ncbi:uncharacterized protein N7518_005544 [Penicillium psychrosexuale]|uniref:uncharacterized protein n=1 Tax=Penicillium roqueforti TaxID=5082 RepID=UPI00190A1375|nr:uncharacterized protein LCP9604111_3416 [Penicillium roqueforti]XP_057043241.1 uncharacterized protein N7518_005544 [Penicillium psychrosexuale]KAF9250514.1 hypothetical protein LCP9604111_3416 [Penicillium roqueforti]KAI2698853.1 hypothetical protein CBS147372_6700 [Penicillium roqueforti]KAI3129590.1 hypothetical protein CBS147330_5220 [Penicillium roqueforti]KAI3133197.1 hypothetical protein CBS147326_5000 [Penicillium roqueforti]KAI3152692.1 hypothetical protein CBS147317_7070 [Penicil
MPNTLPLLRGQITYSKAQKEEINILRRLEYPNRQKKFFANLSNNNQDWIKDVITHHLGLRSNDLCEVADVQYWLHGSFNVCIPVSINDWQARKQSGTRVLLRLPLPYRLGEDFCPGNCDEKIRCEAGTYAWLQENCPDIPIPRLYGFATSDGQTLSHIESLPLLSRCFQHFRRLLLSFFGHSLPSSYVSHPSRISRYEGDALPPGYMVIEYIESNRGQMLSSTWLKRNQDPRYRRMLFRDFSRILLSLARIPLPSIGSFVIDKDGYLQLANRPLSLEIQDLENDHIPTNMPRSQTYSAADSYIMDLLGLHNSRLRNQANAINNLSDYIYQASALTGMQATFPSFFTKELCRGPFTFILTDLHQSNIFVDDDWHITSLIDLEWACSRPTEMIRTPTWLTNKAVDEISEDAVEYEAVRSEFMEIMENEEGLLGEASGKANLSGIMDRSWRSGTFWFSLALASPTGLFSVFYKQIQPRFSQYCKNPAEAFQETMSWYWAQDFVRVGAKKRQDRIEYDTRLRAAFGVSDEAD